MIRHDEWCQDLFATQAFVILKGMQKLLAQSVKGFIADIYSRRTVERDLEAIHEEAVVKRTRRMLSGGVAQKGG